MASQGKQGLLWEQSVPDPVALTNKILPRASAVDAGVINRANRPVIRIKWQSEQIKDYFSPEMNIMTLIPIYRNDAQKSRR
jgi:hypothetical protein